MSLSLFNDQRCFNTTSHNPMVCYELISNTNGGPAFEWDVDNKILGMIEEILSEIFRYDFKQQYVEKDTVELWKFVLSTTTNAVTRIEASFLHLVAKARIMISPDDIFE